MPKNYAIIENTPGYLPEDDDPPTFDRYAEAVNFVAKYYNDIQELGFVVTPIINGQFAYYKNGDDGDLGRVVEIVRVEDEQI